MHQHRIHPAIHLTTVLALNPKFLAGRNEPANLLQTQLLDFVHADLQSSA